MRGRGAGEPLGDALDGGEITGAEPVDEVAPHRGEVGGRGGLEHVSSPPGFRGSGSTTNPDGWRAEVYGERPPATT